MTKKLLVLVSLAVAVAMAGFLGSPRGTDATFWTPAFGPTDFYNLNPTAAGAHGDVHAQFNVFAPSSNFSAAFGRAQTLGDADVATANDAGIPGVGAYIGSLSSVAILGLANEGCNSVVPVTFNFVEANTAVTARPFTGPSGAVTVGGGGIPNAADNTTTDVTYVSTGGVDPLGIKQGADVAGLGTAPEGTVLAGVNEIQIDTEQMLVVGVDNATNQWRLIRGWNGTTPAAHAAGATVSRMSVIYPNGPGTNLLANLGEDDGDLDNNGVAEEAAGPPGGPQFNGNQVADGADAVPSFVRNSLDPNVDANDGGYVQAYARYSGVAFVASSLIVILQFVIMAPGAMTSFPNMQWENASFGYSSSTFLNDPLAPASDSAITDFCNFSSNTDIFGVTHDNACTDTLAAPPGACTGTGAGFTLRLAVDGGGPVNGGAGPGDQPCPAPPVTSPNECGSFRSTNPATAQVVRYYQYSVSQRDYDDDGIENALDTCSTTPNGTWDPRNNNILSGGDADGDGLPDACDPAPGTPNNDQDCDGDPNPAPPCNSTGWFNRLDNCPTVANVAPVMAQPNQNQFDQDVPAGVNVPDGGPPQDNIGPECDTPAFNCGGCVGNLSPTGANGHYHTAFATQSICIGGGGANAAMCNSAAGLAGGASDPDNDGWVNGSDTCVGIPGTNPAGPNASIQSSTVGNADTTMSAAAIAGAGTISVTNSNGFKDGQTILIGTLGSGAETMRYISSGGVAPGSLTFTPPLTAGHAAGTVVTQTRFAQADPDLNGDGFSDITDLASLQNAFGSQGGNPDQDGVGDSAPPGYDGRLDLTYDRFVDISDVAYLSGDFGAACGPP